MIIRINPQGQEPIFEQIVYQIKGAVARGELVDGDKLPSVRALAREVSINPNTVSRAYELLHREGVIVRRQGAGCFVRVDRGSSLRASERLERLNVMTIRAVTDAFHLGCEPQEIRDAVDEALDTLSFEGEMARVRDEKSKKRRKAK